MRALPAVNTLTAFAAGTLTPAAAARGRHLDGAGSINLVRPERKSRAGLYYLPPNTYCECL